MGTLLAGMLDKRKRGAFRGIVRGIYGREFCQAKASIMMAGVLGVRVKNMTHPALGSLINSHKYQPNTLVPDPNP